MALIEQTCFSIAMTNQMTHFKKKKKKKFVGGMIISYLQQMENWLRWEKKAS